MAEERKLVKEKYYPIPEDDPDYEPGKYDCVREYVDKKGLYWTKTVVVKDPETGLFK